MGRRPSTDSLESIKSYSATSSSGVDVSVDVGSNNSIATLVYAGRDARIAGYRLPTIEDIPQVKLPRIERVANSSFEKYMADSEHDSGSIEDTKFGTKDLQSLDEVPEVFFSQNFSLDSPRIFESVKLADKSYESENSELDVDTPALQERLSCYIDTIELQLIQEINSASTSVFSATALFDAIEEHTTIFASEINGLRDALLLTDTEIVQPAMKTISLQRQIAFMNHLDQCLAQIETFKQMACEVDISADENRPSDCFEHLENCRAFAQGDTRNVVVSKWAASHNYPLCNLSNIDIIKIELHRLSKTEQLVGRKYVDLISDALIQDLNKHMQRVQKKYTLQRISRHLKGSSSPSTPQLNTSKEDTSMLYSEVSSETRNTFVEMFTVASRLKSIQLVMKRYEEEVSKEVAAIIRGNLPIDEQEIAQEVPTGLRKNNTHSNSNMLSKILKEQTPEENENMLLAIVLDLTEMFRRIQTQQKLLIDIISRFDVSPIGLKGLIDSQVRFADDRLSKLLRVRSMQTAELSVALFTRLYTLIGMFMYECETISGVNPPQLERVLAQETKGFLAVLHKNHLNDALSLLECDSWKKVLVPHDFQATVDEIVDAGLMDPQPWRDFWQSIVQPILINTSGSTKRSPQNVFVNNSSYFVSQISLLVTRACADYLKLVSLLPAFSFDLAVSTIDLVTNFNNKTRQMILGAGLTRINTGKEPSSRRVTARHLAMGSECLRLIGSLMPFIRKYFERHIPTKITSNSVLEDMDKLASDLSYHQHEMYRKIVSILADKVKDCCKEIIATDWQKVPEDSDPSRCIRDLVSNTVKISQILDDYIPKIAAFNIMSEIFDIYKARLLEAYASIDLETIQQRNAVLRDLVFLKESAQEIGGAGNAAEVIYESVKNFALPRDAVVDSASVPDRYSSSYKTVFASKNTREPEKIVSPETDARSEIKSYIVEECHTEDIPKSTARDSTVGERLYNETAKPKSSGDEIVVNNLSLEANADQDNRSRMDLSEFRKSSGLTVNEAAALLSFDGQMDLGVLTSEKSAHGKGDSLSATNMCSSQDQAVDNLKSLPFVEGPALPKVGINLSLKANSKSFNNGSADGDSMFLGPKSTNTQSVDHKENDIEDSTQERTGLGISVAQNAAVLQNEIAEPVVVENSKGEVVETTAKETNMISNNSKKQNDATSALAEDHDLQIATNFMSKSQHQPPQNIATRKDQGPKNRRHDRRKRQKKKNLGHGPAVL